MSWQAWTDSGHNRAPAMRSILLISLLAACAAPVRRYTCPRRTIVVDGRLDDWGAVAWTEDFVDIEGDKRPAPRFRTRAKMAWDEKCFYFAFEMEEPHLQASFTKRDSFIFREDNDIEIFLDPRGRGRDYFELELNALNTVWDLFLSRPYRRGGAAVMGFDFQGLETAVRLQGTLNDPSDTDRGWTVEVAIPWQSFAQVVQKPRPGATWRVNFSRVQWRFDVVNGKYVKPEDRTEDNWVWSPQHAINMHAPEHWGIVEFAR